MGTSDGTEESSAAMALRADGENDLPPCASCLEVGVSFDGVLQGADSVHHRSQFAGVDPASQLFQIRPVALDCHETHRSAQEAAGDISQDCPTALDCGDMTLRVGARTTSSCTICITSRSFLFRHLATAFKSVVRCHP